MTLTSWGQKNKRITKAGNLESTKFFFRAFVVKNLYAEVQNIHDQDSILDMQGYYFS